MGIDAQVPDVAMVSTGEKEYFHVSKKKRNAPNALNKKRKNLVLYDHIVEFDYEILKSIEEKEEEEYENNKIKQKPWATLIGRVSFSIYFISKDFQLVLFRMEQKEWENYWIKQKLR
jgi:hypothetical protein